MAERTKKERDRKKHRERIRREEAKLRVPNRPIREAVEYYAKITDPFIQHGEHYSYDKVARELGWFMRKIGKAIQGDQRRVKRTLGITPEHGIYRQSMQYDNAVKIIRAIGRDPWEFDL